MVRLTDRPDMTLDVYRGRKTTMEQQQQFISYTDCAHALDTICINMFYFQNYLFTVESGFLASLSTEGAALFLFTAFLVLKQSGSQPL